MIEEIIFRKFAVKDYWYRIEFQHRGSVHIHGFLWLDGAPDISNIDLENVDQVSSIINYFDNLLTACNHFNHYQIGERINPCKIHLSDVEVHSMYSQIETTIKKYLADYKVLINTINRHTAHHSGCLRKNRRSGLMECRFKFPKTLQNQSTIEPNAQNGKLELRLKRNDGNLNSIIPSVTVINRSNTDFQPIISLDCCINYISKYAGKDEPQSNELALIRSIGNRRYNSTTSIIQSVLTKHCALRDYSAQECIYIVMGFPFYKSSRKFVVLNISDNAFVPLEQGNLNNEFVPRDIVASYANRLDTFEPPLRRGRRSNNPEIIQQEEENRQRVIESIGRMSLYEFYSNYYFSSSRWHRYDKKPVLRIFPRLKFIPNQNNEDYFKYKIKLYIPWTINFEESLNPKNLRWVEIYQQYLNLVEDRLNLDDIEIDEDEFEDVEDDNESLHDADLHDWMIYMRERPGSAIQDEAELGLREQDTNYNWADTYNNYDIDFQINYIRNLRELNDNLNNNPVAMPQVNFSPHQQRVLDVLNAQIQYLRDGVERDDFRRSIVIQGKAGSGKSTLIQAIKFRLDQEGIRYRVCAPTGAAASLIEANTIHSVFKINIDQELRSLYRNEKNNFQEDFRGCKFLIIDEMSLVGCSLLRKIDLRCRTATGITNVEFGGMFILLFGDLKQLPPVRDRAFYGTNYNNAYVNEGQNAFNNIDSSIILPSSFRQAPEQQIFRNLLDRVADGLTNQEDLDNLNSRALPNLNQNEQNRFQNSIRLFGKCNDVHQFNMQNLRAFEHVYRIESINNCRTASMTKSSEAGNLEKILYLAIGSRVTLRRNLCTDAG